MNRFTQLVVIAAVVFLNALHAYCLDCTCNNFTPFRGYSSLASKVSAASECLSEAKLHYKSDERIACLEQTIRKAGDTACSLIVKANNNIEDPAVKAANSRLTGIIVVVSNNINYNGCDATVKTYYDFDQFMFNLYAGYEFATVNKLFESGTPRVGMLTYFNYGDPVPEYKHGFGWYGLQHSFVVQLTGSAEQKIDVTTSPPPNKVNLGDKKAVEFAMPLYAPVYRTQWKNNNTLFQYLGPYFEIGGKKVDENDKADLRYYGGIRLAKNPEAYVDFTYGRTTSISGSRIEAKAQLPIFRFENNTRLYLGAIGNFGVDRKDNEADVIRAYLTWNVDVMDVFASKSKQ